MNRDRLREINGLLERFKQQIIDYPNRLNDVLKHDNIYGNLVRCNTPIKVNNSNLFGFWINNNKRNNTEVYVSYNHPYFCQFVSQNEKMFDQDKHHKIYLSLEPEYVQMGVERLFNFIDGEGMPHSSKVGKLSRDDQIVVRVNNREDCEKVISFIENDKYIQEGKKKPNPFSFQERGVAIAFDGGVSYNTGMAYMIEVYLREYLDRVDEIGVNTFIDYCVDYYNKYFVKKEDIDKVFDDFRVDKDVSNVYEMVDYKYCLKLFLNGLSNDFNYNKYEELIENKQKNSYKDAQEFSEYLNKDNYMDLFNELCKVMLNKYGYEDGSWQIKEFIDTGEGKYITRDNNLRRRVSNKEFINYIVNYARSNGITIDSLINMSYQNSTPSMFSENNNELLKKGINTTYSYHQKLYEQGEDIGTGYDYARSAIVRLLRDGKYNGFTRTDNIRIQIENRISREEACKLVINELGLDGLDDHNLFDIADQYLDRILEIESEKLI